MPSVLLLQTSRSRDVADDAALIAAAQAVAPVDVLAATVEPERTERLTGLRTVSASRTSLRAAVSAVDTVVLLGGRPLAGAAGRDHQFSLPELAALSLTLRATGRRLALVGVGAGPVSSRAEALCLRRVVLGSALTVLDDVTSVPFLTATGVPLPIRVGSDLAWLGLQEPPRVVAPTDVPAELWAPLTAGDSESMGGTTALADQLRRVAARIALRRGQVSVVVQGWHGGSAAGVDLDLATEVAGLLNRAGQTARVAAPASSLWHQRELMEHAALVLSGHRHPLLAARAAGVPALLRPYDPAAAALAGRLEIPILPGRDGPNHNDPETSFDQVVDRVLLEPSAAFSTVRQQVAAAGEVGDLLRVLTLLGTDLPRPHSAPRPGLGVGLRPTGVMR